LDSSDASVSVATHDDVVALVGHVLDELHRQVERLGQPGASDAALDRHAELRRAVELVRMLDELLVAADTWRARP